MPTTLKESVLAPQSTLQQSLSTWLLRSSNSLAMLLRTTKKPESFQGTSYSPSETTRNSTNFCQMPPLPKEVSSPTFQEPLDQTKKAQETNPKLCDLFLYVFFLLYTHRSKMSVSNIQTPTLNQQTSKRVRFQIKQYVIGNAPTTNIIDYKLLQLSIANSKEMIEAVGQEMYRKPEKQKKTTLITFDEEEIVLQQQPIEQVAQGEIVMVEQDNNFTGAFSNVSEGEKSKIQRRNKVQEYINYRRSMGLSTQDKRNGYQDEDELQGALIDELGLIENVENFNRQIELFIIAFNKNPQNAISDYIKKGIIKDDTPESIAEYLIKVEGLDKQLLGQYFGKNNPKNLKILHSFCQLLKFPHVEFDRAIRQLLGRFRLPGQSQQIQRIIWQFSLAYFEANSDQHKNADELFPLAYAIIMLATDAHNPKQQKKMSKQQFIKNTQYACPTIQSEYLSGIFDRITKQKFQTEVNYIQTLYARLRGVSSNDFQSILKLTKELMKGDVFLKACYGAKKFVQRKIYLSEDEKRIEWVNDPQKSESEEPRFINIDDITDLTLGLGSEVMKRNNVPQQFDSLCFTITTYLRTLDLKAKTNKERAKWVNYIRAILIRRREARIEKLEQQTKTIMRSDQIEQIWNTQIFPHWDDHWDYHKKKPKVKNVIVRKFQAICGCFSKENKGKKQNQFENSGNSTGKLIIKSSLLQTLWGLGLPPNSRKILWPLVIGNNLALTPTVLQEIKKRVKVNPQLRKFTSFNNQIMEQAQICREFRPDIPPVRDLLLVSQTFWRVFPKSQSVNTLNSLLNLLHVEHFLAFYRADKNQIDSRIKLFEYLLEINAKKVKDHFIGLKLQTKMFLVSWFLSVFFDCFSENEEFLLRIWDNFLLEGEIYLFKVGITIVKYYEIQLKMCTFHEGLKLLRFPKDTSPVLFFKILQEEIDVKQQYYSQYVQKRKNAVIKTKVQAIPLQ